MKLVIDTNVVYTTKGRLLHGPEMDAIHEARADLDIEIIIPEVVHCEIINRFRKDYAKRFQDLNNAWRKLKAITPFPDRDSHCPSIPSIEDATHSYQELIGARCAELGATIAATPLVPHNDLIRRCLQERKPFNTSGSGYRDCLIWHTALEILRNTEDTLLLATANSKDFACPTRPDVLHPDLARDLEDLGCPSAVYICRSLDDAVRKHVRPLKTQVTSLRQMLKDESLHAVGEIWADYHDDITEQMRDAFPLDDTRISEVLGATITGARIRDLNVNVEEEHHDDIRAIRNDRLYCATTVEVLAEIEFVVDQQNAAQLGTSSADICFDDAAWGTHSVLASTILPITLTLTLYYNLQDSSLIDWNVAAAYI